jgi:cobalt/nickel transport system permease protein
MTTTRAPATSTPTWLLAPEVGLCPCGCVGRRRKGSFVSKTIEGSARMMGQALFAEDTAASGGLLQRLDARVTVVSVLGLLIAVSLVRNLPVLAGAYLATVVLAALCRVPLGFFVKRVWLFIPVFTGIVVLPATLNVVNSGHVVVPLGTWAGHHLGVTREGLTGAGVIDTRVATSISLVVLLTLTTPWNKLLAALRALFVPRLFVLVLGMAYRYVFHLLGAVTDMYTARRSRTAGPEHDTRSGRAFVAASAGALFGKTHALAEEVHMAMVSRGYTGDARTLAPRRFRPVDVAWSAAVVVAMVLLLGLDRGL